MIIPKADSLFSSGQIPFQLDNVPSGQGMPQLDSCPIRTQPSPSGQTPKWTPCRPHSDRPHKNYFNYPIDINVH